MAVLFGQKFPMFSVIVVGLALADLRDHCVNETQNCETKDSSLRVNFVLEPHDQTQPGSFSLSLSLSLRCASFRLTVSHNGNQIIYNNCIEIKYTKLGQPFNPNIHIQILQINFPTFSWKISWENLLKDQSTFSLVIILLIPVTFVPDVVLTWLAENRSWSFFGQRVNGTFFCVSVFLGLQSRRYPLRLSNIPLHLLTDHGRELLHAPRLRRSATA